MVRNGKGGKSLNETRTVFFPNTKATMRLWVSNGKHSVDVILSQQHSCCACCFRSRRNADGCALSRQRSNSPILENPETSFRWRTEMPERIHFFFSSRVAVDRYVRFGDAHRDANDARFQSRHRFFSGWPVCRALVWYCSNGGQSGLSSQSR